MESARPPPALFRRDQDVTLRLEAADTEVVRLHVRHVNRAEAWQEIAMAGEGGQFTATVLAAYTDSPFPLQYLFAVLRDGSAAMLPGLAPDLCNQPYYILRRA